MVTGLSIDFWIAQLVAIVVGGLIAGVALFVSHYWYDRYKRPRLAFSNEHLVITEPQDRASEYALNRVRVFNHGRTAAIGCEAAIEIEGVRWALHWSAEAKELNGPWEAKSVIFPKTFKDLSVVRVRQDNNVELAHFDGWGGVRGLTISNEVKCHLWVGAENADTIDILIIITPRIIKDENVFITKAHKARRGRA